MRRLIRLPRIIRIILFVPTHYVIFICMVSGMQNAMHGNFGRRFFVAVLVGASVIIIGKVAGIFIERAEFDRISRLPLTYRFGRKTRDKDKDDDN
jgi:hypothetical protein